MSASEVLLFRHIARATMRGDSVARVAFWELGIESDPAAFVRSFVTRHPHWSTRNSDSDYLVYVLEHSDALYLSWPDASDDDKEEENDRGSESSSLSQRSGE